jgi:hypothetical protein
MIVILTKCGPLIALSGVAVRLPQRDLPFDIGIVSQVFSSDRTNCALPCIALIDSS